MIKKLFFIRHGETDRNLYKMINPWDVDSELNKTWINQAKNVWTELKEKWIFFDIIISSPLKRAKNTAEIIADKIWYKEEIIEIDDLKEKYAWVFKNYYKKQFLEEFGVKIVAEILKKYPNKTFKWVEKLEDFHSRINNVIKSIINNSNYNNKKILIVSHGWVGDIITWTKNIENCKLVKIDF